MTRLWGIKRSLRPQIFFFFFFFFPQLLFAFWLRSGVVTVLISLIADSPALQDAPINLIFHPRDLASMLAYVSFHCVTGLTLPPVDATPFFINYSACPGAWRRKFGLDTLGIILAYVPLSLIHCKSSAIGFSARSHAQSVIHAISTTRHSTDNLSPIFHIARCFLRQKTT